MRDMSPIFIINLIRDSVKRIIKYVRELIKTNGTLLHTQTRSGSQSKQPPHPMMMCRSCVVEPKCMHFHGNLQYTQAHIIHSAIYRKRDRHLSPYMDNITNILIIGQHTRHFSHANIFTHGRHVRATHLYTIHLFTRRFKNQHPKHTRNTRAHLNPIKSIKCTYTNS